MESKFLEPDYLFEVSWEVCHKIGGIHTVISSKAETASSKYPNYFVIGPDFRLEGDESSEFIEDPNLLKEWKTKAAEVDGLKVRIGHWNVNGNPIAILVDQTTFTSEKDKIFARFWERYFLDSLNGGWDYIEPCLFGYAAGAVIHSFSKHLLKDDTKVVAQFHEWMSGAGVLYLKEFAPEIATVFTTHSTVTGRALAGTGQNFYKTLETINGDAEAKKLGVMSKHSLEKAAAYAADCFTAVSEVTGKECSTVLKKNPNIITPNGYKIFNVPQVAEYLKVIGDLQSKIKAVE
mgnify:CR=1 FL=1